MHTKEASLFNAIFNSIVENVTTAAAKNNAEPAMCFIVQIVSIFFNKNICLCCHYGRDFCWVL